MSRLVCSPVGESGGRPAIRVAMGAPRRSRPGCATVGHQLISSDAWSGGPPAAVAADFMTLALAVVAGDTFVRRDEASDGWHRRIELDVTLVDPMPWAPLTATLERALNFLTGDGWELRLRAGSGLGYEARRPAHRLRGDCVALFSGGLDSTAALATLMRQGARPVLVSHAYRGDRAVQGAIRQQLAFQGDWFAANLDPLFNSRNETTMRARSFGFLAMAAMAASVLDPRPASGRVPLIVPENGLIAINPPLTPRRIGALSTRTTHPEFLAQVQAILDAVGMGVQIVNPFEASTKGELLTAAASAGLPGDVARGTVSCGKWKRSGQQCGRCVPCIIRRASFLAAGVVDRTAYRPGNLKQVLQTRGVRDDLVSVATACRRVAGMSESGFGSWVASAGPLPADPARRASLLAVVKRGLGEVRDFLRHEECL